MGQPKAGIAAAAPAMRAATPADLPAINRVIALARDSWDLPERVRRLAGRLHELGPTSFDSYEVIVAEDPEGTVRGVAVMLLGPPVLDDGGPGKTALYLEGLFVEPERGRRGIGSLLLRQVEIAPGWNSHPTHLLAVELSQLSVLVAVAVFGHRSVSERSRRVGSAQVARLIGVGLRSADASRNSILQFTPNSTRSTTLPKNLQGLVMQTPQP